MRLLFEQSFSHSLPVELQEFFPNSAHVHSLGFAHVSDDELWWYAKRHEFCLVSQEVDFAERSALYNAPPKVLWIRGKDGTPSALATFLRSKAQDILQFGEDPQARCFELFLSPPGEASSQLTCLSAGASV